MDAPLVGLVAATALHTGFQLTVTLVVYPALARSPDWAAAHRAHGRSITPVVAVVYGALVATGAWALGSVGADPGVLVSLAGSGTALLTTALVAAPTHGRLGRGRDARLVHRLVVADRVRTLGAAVGLVGALLAG